MPKPLKLGDTGPQVQSLQAVLQTEGVYQGPMDGVFGLSTRQAVKNWQEKHGLPRSGAVDEDTWATLFDQGLIDPQPMREGEQAPTPVTGLEKPASLGINRSLKVVVAPDSFKGSLSAEEACRAIALGLRDVAPQAQVLQMPLADGGEGTAATLVAATGGRMVPVDVLDPLGRPITASFGLLGNGRTAVVEMAAASGLTLLRHHERNPMTASTYGTGQLIAAALSHRIEELIVAIGGSATVDGGSGALMALGCRFLDGEGYPVLQGGAGLASLRQLDLSGLDPRLAKVRLRVACDVDNPLTGPQGAAKVFGPQKGATVDQVRQLDANLGHLASVLQVTTGQDFAAVPGAGAAGGLGFAMLLLGGHLERGINITLEAVGMAELLCGADLVITGEGKIDSQTLHGKTIWGLAQLAKQVPLPVVALVGCEGDIDDAIYQNGVDAIVPLAAGPMDLDTSMKNAAQLLRWAAARAIRLISIGRKL